MSPTQRTLKYYRDLGYTCAMVERWNPHSHVRQDLLGFIDIIGLNHARGIVGIQSTGQAFASHRRKILEERAEECMLWLRCGGRVDLIGWRKLLVKRGGKARRWAPRIEEITLHTFLEDIA